jgi:hypothetical protein
MTCNIDRRGRWARGILGVLIVLGALAWHLALPDVDLWIHGLRLLMGIVGLLTMLGGFIGWCAIRALGFRTPI